MLVAIFVLCCGMFHLEDWFNEEPFRVPVVSDHAKEFANLTFTPSTLNVDYKIDRLSDLGFDVGESGFASHICIA
jgi:hypothetical protein